MRALLLTLLLLAPLASAQPSPALAVELVEDGSILALDTMHLTAKLRFRVTNQGAASDYVTVPRGELRWASTGQVALGVPTPEFGLALAPGESGEMWVRIDFAEPRVGSDTVRIAFRSERTGATTTQSARLDVVAAPAASARIVVRPVDEAGAPVASAEVVVTELTSTSQPRIEGRRDPSGAVTHDVPPGTYAVRADAPGKTGAGEVVVAEAGKDAEVRLVLARQTRSAALVESRSWTVGDSAWLLAADEALTTLATAPMVHKDVSSRGRAFALRGDERISIEFDPPAQAKHAASAFQALDTAVALSPDGARVAAFDWNGRVHVADVASGRVLWSTDEADDRNPLYPPSSPLGAGFYTSGALAFSADGARLVAGGSNGWTVAFDAATGDALWTRALGGEVRAVRFLPDGSGVLVGAGDWRMRLLDAATGQTRWEARNEFWPFFFVALDNNATLAASGGKDATLRVWDVSSGAERLAVDVWPGFVSGAGIGDGFVTFSDWQFGVRSVDLDGDTRWFRRFPTSNVATTPDGRLALVAWSREGGTAGGLALLDETGTTLWSMEPDLAAACASDVSPFPAKQLKSVHLADLGEGRLRGAAACIGGGVFVVDLLVTDAPRPTTTTTPATTTTTTTTTTRPTGTAPATTLPTPTAGTAPTPGAPAALVVLAVALLALVRRRA